MCLCTPGHPVASPDVHIGQPQQLHQARSRVQDRPCTCWKKKSDLLPSVDKPVQAGLAPILSSCLEHTHNPMDSTQLIQVKSSCLKQTMNS